MKIVYLHQYFNTADMVGSTRSYELARRLVAKGHQVEMVTTWRYASEHPSWFTTNESGINVHWYPLPLHNEMTFRRRISAFFRFAYQSAKKASSLDADVVFATSTPLTIALPAVRAAHRIGCPMVFEVRDLWPEVPIAVGALKNPILRWAARWLERYAYRNSRRIVALSPGMADGVVRAGYPRERVSVIPNSADLDMFGSDDEAAARFRQAHPELGQSPLVLYAGTFGLVNGVAWLVDLAVEAKKRQLDCKFILVGSGFEKEQVTEHARASGVLNDNCFVYDPMVKVDVVAAFQAASLVASVTIALPELEANSANKFFDGLAAGRPIAVNYGGWQADLIREHRIGMAWPRDPANAAEQLAHWLADPQRQREEGLNARSLAEREFDRGHLTDRLEQVLLDALK